MSGRNNDQPGEERNRQQEAEKGPCGFSMSS